MGQVLNTCDSNLCNAEHNHNNKSALTSDPEGDEKMFVELEMSLRLHEFHFSEISEVSPFTAHQPY